jgi:hypothetical protein
MNKYTGKVGTKLINPLRLSYIVDIL